MGLAGRYKIEVARGRPGVNDILILAILLVFAGAAAAQALETRSFTVVTEPQASVWVNDVFFGKAGDDGRLDVVTAASGSPRVLVRADGFKEAARPVPPAHKGDLTIALAKTTDPADLAYQEAMRLSLVDRDKAAAAFARAIKLAPASIPAHIGLIRVLSDGRKYDEALKAIRAVRRIRPAIPEVSAIEGRIEKETGREDKAITAFKRAIREGRGFQPEAYTGLGLLYKERAELLAGDTDLTAETAAYDEAAKNLKIAARQLIGAPDAAVVYQILGLIYEKQKKYDEAIAVYEEFLKIFPTSDEAPAVRSFIVQIKKQQDQ